MSCKKVPAFERSGNEVFYFDTDFVITSILPPVRAPGPGGGVHVEWLFMWKELGSLKNEADEKLPPELQNMDLGFDRLILGG
eukprot:CAMPEP_0117652314 /NCGR_PEP_ID=MMETSP0804-20121206/2560_1 /TAXON_ID=1074897 /ORGANISM="Tetraselmis astigmatica, Strain CCMP880" /LENGTH=81 /DNA_ID=CAMNT_0005458351 /DNA_START=405 /DNA_END=646 /DNA_ORIENTATION=+